MSSLPIAVRAAFPHVWDSTMVASLRACGQKVYMEFFHHWKSSSPNVHLHAGAAYAKGLEVARRGFYEHGLPADEALANGAAALLETYGDFRAPEGSAKTLD